MISVLLPIRTESEANVRECWQAKHRRAKEQQHTVFLGMYGHHRTLKAHRGRFYVTLTRIGVRKLDGDNLQRSFKAIRDQVAKMCGVDDGSDRIGFAYQQERGKVKEYAVKVEVERA